MRIWAWAGWTLFIAGCGGADVVSDRARATVATDVAIAVAATCSFGDPAECARQCASDSFESCNNLGAQYEQGAGVARDVEAARRYYALACDVHLAVACVNLARLGTPQGVSLPRLASVRPPVASPHLGDRELHARTLELVKKLRSLVQIGRRDTRAAALGVKLTYASTPGDVEEYISSNYRALRPLAALYADELSERVEVPLPGGTEPIESARTFEQIERVADALQGLVERLDWGMPHANSEERSDRGA